jgi:CBS domain-containing protein
MVTMKKVFESSLISELRLPKAVTVQSGTTLKDVSNLMCDRSFGCVPIVKDNKLVGIFTERDWLNRVLRNNVSLGQPVDDVMTPQPITLTKFSGIWEAAELMGNKKVRHIPIIDDNEMPVSMVSVRDILRYLAECFPEQFLAHPPDNKTQTFQAEGG